MKLRKVTYRPYSDDYNKWMPEEWAETIPFSGIGIVRRGKTRDYKIVHFGTGLKIGPDVWGRARAEYMLRNLAKLTNWIQVTKANCREKVPNFEQNFQALLDQFLIWESQNNQQTTESKN